MALDLNRALLFGDADGSIRASGSKRRYLAIVDGIVGGEGAGPLCPDAVRAGILLAGTDPAAVDAVAARVMGFDPDSIPIVREAFAHHPLCIADCALEAVEVEDERISSRIRVADVAPVPGGFQPHFGWKSLARSQRDRIRAA
jgi:hypothetical protein